MSELTMPPNSITSPTQPPSPRFGRGNVHSAEKIAHLNVAGPSSDSICDIDQRLQTHEEHYFPGLTFLAAICSSSNIRWDDARKHHYLDCSDDPEVFPNSVHSTLPDHEGSTQPKALSPKVESLYGHQKTSVLEDEACEYEDHIPSSPTLHSMSSPNGTYIDAFSSPPRSSTIAASSPIKSMNDYNSKLYDKPPFIIRPTPIHPHHLETFRPPIVEPSDNCLQMISASPSPLRAPNFISLGLDMSSSPLSSLLSSPLDSTFDEPLSFHHDISSSPPSSPCPHSTTFDQPPDVGCSSDRIQASNPSGRKPAPRKRRGGRASSPTLRSVGLSEKNGLNNSTTRQKVKSKSVFERRQRRSRKRYLINAKTGEMLNTASDKENSLEGSNILEKPFLKSNLDSLPMTGFLVETLALSRASAMTASELLRAVLKTQPQLKQELPEDKWLGIVQEILNGVGMFGRIERKGLDAADCPLEDQWFYIPENDKEPGRADLLKGLMPKKRAVTKQSKQYYYKPVAKLTQWDSEYD